MIENNRRCPCGAEIPETRSQQARYCTHACGGKFRNRAYAKTHPDRILAKRVRQGAFPEKRILARIKHRAKADSIPFNLEESDIVIPDVCPVLGIELVRHQNCRSGYFPNSPSVDRIIPSIGYVKGNIRLISARANLLKNNASVEELEAVLADLRKILS